MTGMDEILFWACAATAAFLVLVMLDMTAGLGRIVALADLPEEPAPPGGWPRLTVVVAARDESATVEPAMRKLLTMDYPALEVIAVDDRSTDGTGAILGRIAAEDPRLRVVRVDELPPGWLGKNHAMEAGRRRASGEWILFTDADVHLGAATLRKSVLRASARGADHVAALPDIEPGTTAFDLQVAQFALLFGLYTRAWKAEDPKSRAHIGVGAFNLVRAAALERAGGFEPIRMRPDDDVRLGRLLKSSGAKTTVVQGRGEVVVAWYSDLPQMIRGLEKNSFAGADYRVGTVVLGTLVNLVTFELPTVVLFSGACSERARLAGGAAVIAGWLCHAAANLGRRHPWWGAVLLPWTTLVFLWTVWRSAIVTLRQGGIRWRGTLYPLRELRGNP